MRRRSKPQAAGCPAFLWLAEVPVRRLDEFELGPIGFITMGAVEHGQEVVAGAAGTIGANRAALLIEMEEQHGLGSRDSMVLKLSELSNRGFLLRSEELGRSIASPRLSFPDPRNP